MQLGSIYRTNNKKKNTKTSAKPAAGFELLRVRAPAKQTSRDKHC